MFDELTSEMCFLFYEGQNVEYGCVFGWNSDLSWKGERRQKVDEMRMKRILESLPRGTTFAMSMFSYVVWLLVVLNPNYTGSGGCNLCVSQELLLLIKI
jgi:hypothetical protein